MPGDYMPDSEDELKTWYTDFEAAAQTHGTTVGWTAGEKTQVTANLNTILHAVNGQSLIRTDAQEWTNYKNILLYAPIGTAVPGLPADAAKGSLPLGAIAGIIAWTRQIVQRTKAHPAYTDAIGADFGILPPGPGAAGAQPTLEGSALTGFQVSIDFELLRRKSIEIHSKRGAEPDFTLLAVDTGPPYIDNRAPLVASTPEQRLYRGRFRDNDDQPIGTWSDIITVTAQP